MLQNTEHLQVFGLTKHNEILPSINIHSDDMVARLFFAQQSLSALLTAKDSLTLGM